MSYYLLTPMPKFRLSLVSPQNISQTSQQQSSTEQGCRILLTTEVDGDFFLSIKKTIEKENCSIHLI